MQKIDIREPKWKPEPSVGIGEQYETDMEITISYKKANGQRPYPETYFIPWERLKYYPAIKFKKGMPMVRLIPISMLDVT